MRSMQIHHRSHRGGHSRSIDRKNPFEIVGCVWCGESSSVSLIYGSNGVTDLIAIDEIDANSSSISPWRSLPIDRSQEPVRDRWMRLVWRIKLGEFDLRIERRDRSHCD